MLHEFERNIGFYRLRLESIPIEKDRIPLHEAMDQLIPLYNNGDAYWIHQNGKQSVRLLELQDADEYYVFLISISKRDIADPAFEHIFTGDYRVEAKQEDEGISYSAHMLVYKNESADHGGISHKVALERIQGLGSSIIMPFLTHLFRQSYALSRPVFWYNQTNRLYRPRVNLTGDLSTTLHNEMQRGRISGVELVDYRNNAFALDEEGILIEKKATLSLTVSGEPDEATLSRMINALRSRARAAQYDQVKIKVERDDTGEQTIPINIDIDQDATETLAVRKELVTVSQDNPLGQRHANIRDDFVDLIHNIEDMI